jgi:hypothetical protein
MAIISSTTNIQKSIMAKLAKVEDMAPKPNSPKRRARIRNRTIKPIMDALLSVRLSSIITPPNYIFIKTDKRIIKKSLHLAALTVPAALPKMTWA